MKFRALFIRERLEQAALLLLPPLTSFYLMQFILGVLPWELAPGVVLANSLCIGAVYFLLWAATGYPAVCCLLLHILCGVWGAANYFVALYRGTPVLPWDLTALGTAAAVSGEYLAATPACCCRSPPASPCRRQTPYIRPAPRRSCRQSPRLSRARCCPLPSAQNRPSLARRPF